MKRSDLDEKKYGRLLSKTCPHIIHNDEELETFTEQLLRLDELDNPSREEDELAALLTSLIEQYEAEHYPIRKATPVETIKFLLEQRSLHDKDLWSIMGGKSHTSEILGGKRGIGNAMASRLATFFHVAPDLFIQWKTMTAGSAMPANDL